MLERIEKLVAMFEQKQIDRRQLIGSLVVAAAAPAAAPAAAAPGVLDGRVLNHVTIGVTDIKRSRAFYERLLGVAVLYDGTTSGAQFYDLRLNGECFISLMNSATPRIDHLCVGIPDFDADRAAADIKQAFPDSNLNLRMNAPSRSSKPIVWRNVFVTDPDGNSVQLADVKYQLDGRR